MGALRIEETFKRINDEGRAAFIPYVTAGDPDIETTFDLVIALEEAGGDLIELGIPFSDPVADGPVIQAAAQRALGSGTSLTKVLELVKKVRTKSQVPIVFLAYFNTIYQFGLEAFAKEAALAGVDGVVLADMPLEEAEAVQRVLDNAGLATILLAAPTTSTERLVRIAELARGFIYCVALKGVTGQRETVSTDGLELVQRLKEVTDKPLAVGFGLSTAEQIAMMGKQANGVIVGSAIVKTVEQLGKDKEKLIEAIKIQIKQLKAGLKIS